MYRYVAYYKYETYNGAYNKVISLNDDEIAEINEIFDTDPDMNKLMTNIFKDCVKDRSWNEVPEEMADKIEGWNWKIESSEKGYVEVLSNVQLTLDELDIMAMETASQISDGYNENPFRFELKNGDIYNITFNSYPITDFSEA